MLALLNLSRKDNNTYGRKGRPRIEPHTSTPMTLVVLGLKDFDIQIQSFQIEKWGRETRIPVPGRIRCFHVWVLKILIQEVLHA